MRVRNELVSFGAADQLAVTQDGVVGGGTHLSPHEVHELFASRGDEVVFFDARNSIEARVGKFRNAIVPNVPRIVAEFESVKFDHL